MVWTTQTDGCPPMVPIVNHSHTRTVSHLQGACKLSAAGASDSRDRNSNLPSARRPPAAGELSVFKFVSSAQLCWRMMACPHIL